MRPLKIVAPLAALTLLTSACGLFTHHAGKPALIPVWKISKGSLFSTDALVVGNTVIADVGHTPSEPVDKAIFIDGATGRIRGRAATGKPAGLSPTTDKHGRLLVGDAPTDSPGVDPERVYDLSGRVSWRARTVWESFVGGYTTGPQKSAGKYWMVIRTAAGRLVTRLPAPRNPLSGPGPNAALGIDVQVVRPGLLVVTGYGSSGSQAALIDASRLGHARMRPLRPPPMPAHRGPISPGPTAVGGGHVYMGWDVPTGKDYKSTHYVAGYDVPDTRPAWHVALPGGAGPLGIHASSSGQDALAVNGGAGNADSDERVWFLRPDTGALIGPAHGREGQLALDNGLVGGRAYINADAAGTQVIDPRTGTVIRTIPDPGHQSFRGATSSGNLIYAGTDGSELYAYH